jgi:hypothetical protein
VARLLLVGRRRSIVETIRSKPAVACVGTAAFLLAHGATWPGSPGRPRELTGAVAAACVVTEDVRLAAAVCQRLADVLRQATDIHVTAARGTVTLSGHVTDESLKDRASKLAYAVDGVERVDNEIVVVRPPQNPRALSTYDPRR